jgi:molybdopterin/thiamine biosynthesis adenylyltransferase
MNTPSNQPESRNRPSDPDLTRYSRQILCEHIGEAGQRKLCASRVTLIGCGALGSVLADTLVRAGIGFLRIVDRDVVELNNLQRQVLFSEKDALGGVPKAVAAATRLAQINSDVEIEPIVADANPDNIESFVHSAHLLLDGTDNLETRFLINDVAVKHRIPWVYGACIGADGLVLPVVPGLTPCLRCIWDQPPPPGVALTCDTVGVLAPIIHMVASLQIIEALKILTGQLDALQRKLVQMNAWTGQFSQFDLQSARDSGECPCCKAGRYEFLAAGHTGRTAVLCGQRAVQINAAPGARVDFQAIAARVASVAKSVPQFNRYLLRFEVDSYQITLFSDGRAIIAGTTEPNEARSVYARYIGT